MHNMLCMDNLIIRFITCTHVLVLMCYSRAYIDLTRDAASSSSVSDHEEEMDNDLPPVPILG